MGSFSSKPSSKQRSGSNAVAAKTPPPTITDIDRAVLDLKNSRDRLQRYRIKLDNDNNKLIEKARIAKGNGQSITAINLLKLRKFKQQQLQSVEEQLLNVHTMVDTIDSTRNDTIIIAAMSKGKDALKKLHDETTVDDVLKLLDEISEQNELENEISTVISDAINNTLTTTTTTVFDESELEAELAALTAGTTTVPPVPATTMKPDDPLDDVSTLLPDVPDTPLLPQVPQTPLDATTTTSTTPVKNTEPVAVPA